MVKNHFSVSFVLIAADFWYLFISRLLLLLFRFRFTVDEILKF